MKETKFYEVSGRVQGVMFRQTLIRGAEKRGIEAGATNLPNGKVSFVLIGENEKIEEIISFLRSGKKINSWEAKIEDVRELDGGINFNDHEVNTSNVNKFKWESDIEMYL